MCIALSVAQWLRYLSPVALATAGEGVCDGNRGKEPSLQQQLPSPASPLTLLTTKPTNLENPSLPQLPSPLAWTPQPRPLCLYCTKTLSLLWPGAIYMEYQGYISAS